MYIFYIHFNNPQLQVFICFHPKTVMNVIHIDFTLYFLSPPQYMYIVSVFYTQKF